MMKKWIAVFICSVMALFPVLPVSALADASDITVYIDGNAVTFDAPPRIVDGTTLVPMRKIFEEQGATIGFDPATSTITATKGAVTIRYAVGEKTALRNDESVALTTPGRIIGESTFVPLRFVSEALGATVGWEQRTRTITISSALKEKARVLDIFDGDTLVLLHEDGTQETVHLAGVDAPEVGYGLQRDEPYSREALDFLWYEVLAREVSIERETASDDNEGLPSVYLYLQDGTLLNSTLVIEGYARSDGTPQTGRWGALLEKYETYALQEGIGLWASHVRTTVQDEDDEPKEDGVPEGLLAETATYTNEHIGFQVEFPGRWVATRFFDNPGVAWLHISTRTYRLTNGMVWPYVDLYGLKPTDLGMTDRLLENLREKNEDKEPVETDVTVGGLPAKKLETDWIAVEDRTGKAVLIVLKDGDLTFLIEYIEMKDDPEGHTERIREIIQSITFQ